MGTLIQGLHLLSVTDHYILKDFFKVHFEKKSAGNTLLSMQRANFHCDINRFSCEKASGLIILVDPIF